MLIDTHCHIYKEYYENIDNIMEKIQKSGVKKIINNGCDDISNKEIINLISEYKNMYGALGIHPENANDYKKEQLEFIKNHLKDPKIVAIGEIGLDYHYEKNNKEKQISIFEHQLKLAEKYSIPVIVHSRDATLDTINSLKKYKVKGIIHSFNGSYETACIYIKMGFKLGINGVITFKNCNLKEVIKRIDLSNIVLETDSPYLTPEPFRGKKNDSSHINEIAEFIANLKSIKKEELAKITNKNVKSVFDI